MSAKPKVVAKFHRWESAIACACSRALYEDRRYKVSSVDGLWVVAPTVRHRPMVRVAVPAMPAATLVCSQCGAVGHTIAWHF